MTTKEWLGTLALRFTQGSPQRASVERLVVLVRADIQLDQAGRVEVVLALHDLHTRYGEGDVPDEDILALAKSINGE